MIDYPAPQESLNELRLELERMTFAEAEAKDELGIFFEALDILTDFKNEERLLSRLLNVFRRSLKFEDAFILESREPSGDLVAIFSTSPRFDGAKFHLSPTLRRAQHCPVACYEIAEVEEWKDQPDHVRSGVVSALYLRVKDEGHGTVLVCTHSARGFFGWKDFDRAQKFAAFLSQALIHRDHTRRLRMTNESLQHEIAEREKAEALLAKQQLQIVQASRMAALGEMAGGIAHEVNNPLAIIQNGAEQLAELVKSPQIDRDLILRLTSAITRTVERIAEIVRGLRSFSRDDAQEPFRPTPVRSIVENVLALCREKLRQNRIRLDLDLPDDSVQVDCHPIQIEQVLLNLIVNARDAVLDLPDKWIRISADSSPTTVTISVTDSGNGIPEPIRHKIFDPFFTTKEIGKSMGLGLSISRGLVELHRGALELDPSQPNTTFTMRLRRTIL